MKATITVEPFNLPNFLRLDVPLGAINAQNVSMDVAHLFPTDKDAADFWDESKAAWIEHVRKRRSALGESA